MRSAQQASPGTLEIMEQAVHLLRLAPARILASYYIGATPFVLGLMYFWADMSRSGFAGDHVVAASLALAVLFVWMKCWQCVFCSQLHRRVSGLPAEPWSAGRIGRMIAAQGLLQPTGLIVLPLAGILLLPAAWAFAFYQNATVLGRGRWPLRRATLRARCWRQARLWPVENHLVLTIFALLGLFLLANLAAATLLVPQLLRMFLGVETQFSRLGALLMLNTTFLTVMCGAMYLCLDPAVKAVYTLRCFHGESLRTGQDIRAELRSVSGAGRAAGVVLALVLSVVGAGGARAADGPPGPARTEAAQKTGLAPQRLDRTIDDVIRRRKYAWRMPRPKKPDTPAKGFLTDVFGKVRQWIDSWWPKEKRKDTWDHEPWKPDRGEGLSPRLILYMLLGVTGAVMVALAVYYLLGRRSKRAQAASPKAHAEPDLTDADVAAADLPEDEWMALAREMIGKGELRLALRALYLACLAHLSMHGAIRVEKFKSNREYEAELGRRRHAQPELVAAFARNVTMFEDAWYGMHEVTRPVLASFSANHERIRAVAQE